MTSLDFYLKNNPIDQIAIERPWLEKLMAGKKAYPGAKQYIVEQLRTSYDSNFQWFNGAKTVTYNKRKTVKQANFPWGSAHDGFALDEDRLVQNGITMIEGKTQTASDAEVIQLTNLLTEQNEVLRLGFEEAFDIELHKDGTQNADAIAGLELLVQIADFDNTAPTWATVGGINSATSTYWRNYTKCDLDITVASGDLNGEMEKAWRSCVKNGGAPDFIMAGHTFIDHLRNFMMGKYGRVNYGALDNKSTEIGTGTGKGTDTGLRFHGVPVLWNPEFDNLTPNIAEGSADAAGKPSWRRRMYMINSKHMKLRPLSGQDMVTRKPPRAYDKYEYYFGVTWRGSLTTNRRSAHAALATDKDV